MTRLPFAIIVLLGLLCPRGVCADDRSDEQKRIDEAVSRALKYLARHQEASGAWRIRAYGESTAATSLAVMAFLAAGHVPGEGPYGKKINDGIQWVLDHQKRVGTRAGKETVMLVHRRSHGPMYSHGISTLMLAEVVGMMGRRQGKECRDALEKSIRLILDAQDQPKLSNAKGGWRYNPSSRDADLSVTGWQLMALRAAKNVGCDVPKTAIDKAVRYVKMCRPRDGRGFSYMPFHGASETRTGTGITCLEVCGEHKCDEAMLGAEYLLSRPLRYHSEYFYYGAYYCTVGMFKVGGKYWESCRSAVFDALLNNQNGDGSWAASRGSERNAGEVYCTAMAVLALAVEYRYLPIYQR